MKNTKNKLNTLPKDQLVNILRGAPFFINQEDSMVDLTKIYEGWYHKHTNATIIRNYGAKLIVTSPLSGRKSIIWHYGFCIDVVDYGLEVVNVGIYGDLANSSKVIVRTDSACPPSFLYGSLRCNCWDQWVTSRELAANYHHIALPSVETGKQLEEFTINYKSDSSLPAFILIYLDSQCGMGSGILPNKYNTLMAETAFMRHRGEYTAEQRFAVSMKESFKILGIEPDLRGYNNGLGYKIPGIILDCLGIEKNIILLTNNPLKKNALLSMGYLVRRHPIYGRYDVACELETRERVENFGHQIDYVSNINPIKEANRIKEEIENGAF